MAGVRSKPEAKTGTYRGWFTDMNGKQRSFTGTCDRADTLRMARRLEDDHRQIRLGYREAPKSWAKHKARPYAEATGEYMAWGESQGGHGGRPWGKGHARMRRARLTWWGKRLGLGVLADLDGILPRFEEALRDLGKAGRSGKTLQNYRESLSAFCKWAKERGYLGADPLQGSVGYDTTPQTIRRAMTPEEIRRLLQVAPGERALLYEAPLCSGLRRGELESLSVEHLDVERSGLWLDGHMDQKRKPQERVPGASRGPCGASGGVCRERGGSSSALCQDVQGHGPQVQGAEEPASIRAGATGAGL